MFIFPREVVSQKNVKKQISVMVMLGTLIPFLFVYLPLLNTWEEIKTQSLGYIPLLLGGFYLYLLKKEGKIVS